MAPAPLGCPERERLLEELKAVNGELADVHDAEVYAAVNGDTGEFDALQPRLVQARQYREGIIDRLIRHMRDHGC